MYTIVLTLCHREGDHQIEITKEFPSFEVLATFYHALSGAFADSNTFIRAFTVTPDPVAKVAKINT